MSMLTTEDAMRMVARSVFVLGLLGGTSLLNAQESGRQSGGVLLEFPNFGPIPGSQEPSMGPGPGALEPSMLAPETGIIGGRRRAGRIPRASKNRQVAPSEAMAQAPGTRLPVAIPERAISQPTTTLVTSVLEDEGPPDGLTLDAAIQQMLSANLDVLALKYEIPQADADILTAGLRANPLIYGDTQFIPYGAFTNQRPGGPTQYDLNITYPLDVSHKRQARVRVAKAARTVLEAQFQDVIRRQIGNVYHAFLDLQSARINLLTAQATVREQERVFAAAMRRTGKAEKGGEEASERLSVSLDKARASLDTARDSFKDSQEALAVLLNVPPDQTPYIHTNGTLRDLGPLPPPLDDLTRLALEQRPDMVAARRGIGRAQADLSLQRANQLDDIFLFYDPITYQDNSPSKALSSRSWTIAVTFPLPIYNRNQGNIARAQSNLHQTAAELAALERRVVSEVRLAEREYRSSRQALERAENVTFRNAHRVFERNAREFAAGKISADDYLSHLDDESEAASGFRDALIRHRRSMLDLNTAVGQRLLP
jgi:cobalt-zinc-cadmium efflux system outer membrane protein